MARFEFKSPQLVGFTWDNEEKLVYMTDKAGMEHALPWAKRCPWSPLTTTLVINDEYHLSFTEQQINRLIKSEPISK